MGGEITLLAVRGCVRCFNQGSTQPLAAFARLAAQSFAPAFMIARAHACPGGQVPHWETGSYLVQFRPEDFRHASDDAWNGFQAREKIFVGMKSLRNLHAHPVNGILEFREMLQVLS